jgi:hypothetical protein
MADFAASFTSCTQNLPSTIDPFDFVAFFSPPTAADATPPVVDGFVPAPGEIAPTQALQFDVADNAALAAVTVLVRLEAVPPSTQRPYEVIYDSDGFADAYAQRSTLEQLTETHWRFTVQRAGGWPSAPRLKIIASDGRVAE